MGKKSRRRQKSRSKKKIERKTAEKSQERRPIEPCGEAVLEIGQRVMLSNLKSTRYNGKIGKIVSIPKDTENGRYGVVVEGHMKAVGIRRRNMTKEISTRALEMEQDRIQSLTSNEKGSMNADSMERMNMLIELMLATMSPKDLENIFGYDEVKPIPNFSREVRVFPREVDMDWAKKHLRHAFQQSRFLPYSMMMAWKNPDHRPTEADILKRLGRVSPKKLDWYFSSSAGAQGDIYPHRDHDYEAEHSSGYPTFMTRHSYSNRAYKKEIFYEGETHVAAGFVDLGILLVADLCKSKATGDSLKFVGIEMSAYSVAKTRVILEMLRTRDPSISEEDHARSIAQVWYSSTWTARTHLAVKAALDALCSVKGNYHSDVHKLLEHWKSAKRMSLKDTRDRFAKTRTCNSNSFGDLVRRHDREDMIKYQLTGDFASRGTVSCGNILMFDCPDGMPPLTKDETIFSTIDAKYLVGNSTMPIFDVAEAFIVKNVRKIARWIQSDRVEVTLLCMRVQDAIGTISKIKPDTMSWSNLLDYMSYATFHQMARSCSSGGDTTHFAYSMNWITEIRGPFIHDYVGDSERLEKIFETTRKSVDFSYAIQGRTGIFRTPPNTNPINTTTTHCLAPLFRETWVKHFFSQAERSGNACTVARSEISMGSPLSTTGNATVDIAWTYNPDLSFVYKEPPPLSEA